MLAALVETIPVRLDDNISVPATAGGGAVDREPDDGRRRWPARAAAIVAALPWAIGVNALTAWLGYRARTVSRSGAIGGALVGAIIYAGGGGGRVGAAARHVRRRVGRRRGSA